MLIPLRTLEEIAAGRVDLAFRRWARPMVKTGGSATHRDRRGAVRRGGRRSSSTPSPTPRPDGPASPIVPRSPPSSTRHRDGQLYRIRLHREGDDPRVALREDDAPRRRHHRVDHHPPRPAGPRQQPWRVDARHARADPRPPRRAGAGSRGVGRARDAAVQARRPQAQEPRPDGQPPRRLRAVTARPRVPRPHRTGSAADDRTGPDDRPPHVAHRGAAARDDLLHARGRGRVRARSGWSAAWGTSAHAPPRWARSPPRS